MTVRISDEERRRRLVSRHHLDRSAASPAAVVDAVAALHSTDPTTPYLSARARVPEFEIADLERELFDQRTLWRMHTIRRTLFIVATDQVPVFEAGATREIARKERARLVGWLKAEMDPGAIEPWLEDLAAQVLGSFGGEELSTREITGLVPDLSRQLTLGSGKWATRAPVSSRLLFLLAMEGLLVRTRPAGSWRSSQYKWAKADEWSPTPLPTLDEGEGRSRIAARYLETHGPITMTDLRWWTGWTLSAARQAIDPLDLTEVELDSGDPGLILAGDTYVDDQVGPSTAFLPSLDSTVMGWKERHWYLGSHAGELFDTNGNAGPTVWVDGRVVGGWGQNPDGKVVYQLLEELNKQQRPRVDAEADSLSSWLDGVVVMPRFPSPLGRRLAL